MIYLESEDRNVAKLNRQISKSKAHHYKLILGDLPIPPFPFLNVPFNVQIFLVDHEDQMVNDSLQVEEIDLFVKLCYYEEDPSDPLRDAPDILSIESPTPLKISRHDSTNINLKLTDLSMNHENEKFVLVFSADPHNGRAVARAVSGPLYCIQHKLVVEEQNAGPYIWYKDEGSKEKCIELVVKLKDSLDNYVSNRRVPLKATLCYGGQGMSHFYSCSP